MGKLYDLAVKIGEYEKDGQTKNRYKNIGAMWEGQEWNGQPGTPYIRLDALFNPAGVPRKEGSDSIIVTLFKPKDRDNSGNYGGGSYSSAPAERYRKDDGSTWTRQSNGNWTKDQPEDDMNFKFKDGPEGMNDEDIPF